MPWGLQQMTYRDRKMSEIPDTRTSLELLIFELESEPSNDWPNVKKLLLVYICYAIAHHKGQADSPPDWNTAIKTETFLLKHVVGADTAAPDKYISSATRTRPYYHTRSRYEKPQTCLLFNVHTSNINKVLFWMGYSCHLLHESIADSFGWKWARISRSMSIFQICVE